MEGIGYPRFVKLSGTRPKRDCRFSLGHQSGTVRHIISCSSTLGLAAVFCSYLYIIFCSSIYYHGLLRPVSFAPRISSANRTTYLQVTSLRSIASMTSSADI